MLPARKVQPHAMHVTEKMNPHAEQRGFHWKRRQTFNTSPERLVLQKQTERRGRQGRFTGHRGAGDADCCFYEGMIGGECCSA